MSATVRSVSRSAHRPKPVPTPARGLAGAGVAESAGFVPSLTVDGIYAASRRLSRLAEKARAGKRIKATAVVEAFRAKGVAPVRKDGRAWDGQEWTRPRGGLTAVGCLGAETDHDDARYLGGFEDGWNDVEGTEHDHEEHMWFCGGAVAVWHPSYALGRADGVKAREAVWKALGWF